MGLPDVNSLDVPTKEQVDHPSHYGGKDNPYEAIKVIEAWGFNSSFCLGSALKYLARLGKKSDHVLSLRGVKALTIEDLKKARWYIDREISNLEKAE